MDTAVSPTPAQIAPVKSAEITITFEAALQEMLAGKKVTKLSWNNSDTYGYIREALLYIKINGGSEQVWHISEGDIIGLDYVVINK